MKKSILFAAAVLMFAACVKDAFDVLQSVKMYEVVLTGDCQTRTSFGEEENGNLNVLWKAGDMLGLYVSENGTGMSSAQNILSRVVSVNGSGPGYRRGTFSIELPLKESSDYQMTIYYPYNSEAGESSRISHCIPALQTQPAGAESGHLGMSGCFAYSTASFVTPESLEQYSSPQVGFKLDYKTSVIWLKVSAASADMAGWKVKSVTFTAPEGSNLAGNVTYTPSDDSFVLSGNGSNTVALNIPGGAAISADTPANLYMVVFPAELAGKTVQISYTLESADAKQTKVVTHTKTIKEDSEAFSRGSVHCFTEELPAADAEGWKYSEEAIDLSAGGTANCYVVSTPGRYSFDATVIGNGQKGILTPLSTTFFHTDNATIAPTQASLLWQTEKGLITSLAFNNGRIEFTKSSTVEFGNALIAAKDAEGTVLWSWHIWCTDNGASQTYISEYGTYEGMDRNLGATYASSEIVTDAELLVRSLGLFYAWGRKDPFGGPARFEWSSTKYSIPMAELYDIDGNVFTRPAYVTGGKTSNSGTTSSVDWSVRNPTTFVGVGSATSSDWFSSGKALSGKGPEYRAYYLWGNPQGYDFKTSAKQTPVKTIYDPCPAGYMVPPPDFYNALTSKGRNNYGHVLSTGVENTWYPLASILACGADSNNGKWACVNQVGYYRSSSFNAASSANNYCLQIWSGGKVEYSGWNTAYGMSVRCVQEIN